MAFAGLILIFAEQPLAWGLGHLSPDLAPTLDAMGQGMRILAFGVPTTFLLLATVFVPDFRKQRAAGYLAASAMASATVAPIMIGQEEAQSVRDRLSELRRTEGAIPAAFVGASGERRGWLPDSQRFDANQYFTVFNRLKPDPGHRLDYVFESAGNGGRPLLYMRRASEAPLESGQAYRARFPLAQTDLPYLHGLSFESSPSGYLQIAWYAIEAPQFYLHWHAQYARLEAIGTRRRLEQIVSELPAQGLSEAERPTSYCGHPQPYWIWIESTMGVCSD
jgi:hypothetical protein